MLEPRIVVEPPADWNLSESVTLRPPDGSASLIVSSEPIDRGIDSRMFADRSVEALALDLPEYQPGPIVPVTLFGQPGFLHHYSWVPPEGRTVGQIQVFAVVNGRSYTGTATAAPWTTEIEAQLLTAIATLRLEPSTAGG